MKKIIIDIDESHQLNIHYGLNVIKTLGLKDDFIYGVLLPSVLLLEKNNNKLIIDDMLFKAIDVLVSPTVNNRNTVIHHYCGVVFHSVLIPLYETIKQFLLYSHLSLQQINNIDISDKGNGLLVSIRIMG